MIHNNYSFTAAIATNTNCPAHCKPHRPNRSWQPNVTRPLKANTVHIDLEDEGRVGGQVTSEVLGLDAMLGGLISA